MLRKEDKVVVLVNDMLIDLPSPVSLSYFWNMGSLLGVFLLIQIVTGLFLAIHFSGDVSLAFDSIVWMGRDVNNGWLIRYLHSNGASLFFLFLYIHIGRGLYYGSYAYSRTWASGVTIFIFSMAAAFLGYVLPWGQMSFWAATVITNLVTAIPYIGVIVVEWLWGGFAVGNPTLTRFFAFHYLLPFIIIGLVMMHLVFLHETGSGNPVGLSSDLDSVEFHPYYSISDLLGLGLVLMVYIIISLEYPLVFMDVENFVVANPLVTPTHIQPEWYFLFAYCILRSVPSKIGGVMALFASVLVLYLIPFLYCFAMRSFSMYLVMRVGFWVMVVNWVILTWIGSCVVEDPYVMLGKFSSVMYFGIFIMIFSVGSLQDKCLVLS